MSDMQDEKQFLQYRGNNTPRILRFAWSLFFIFMVFYCVKFMWPDLVQWLNKIK